MTAKSETVGVVPRWRLRSPKDRADYMSQERDGHYVLFTDHESAMAELRAGYERMDAAYLAQWQATVDAEAKHTALLARIGELADRIEHRSQDYTNGYDRDAMESFASDLRTLASKDDPT
jgi:hypothetical protein